LITSEEPLKTRHFKPTLSKILREKQNILLKSGNGRKLTYHKHKISSFLKKNNPSGAFSFQNKTK
jgi:hypothetical protein